MKRLYLDSNVLLHFRFNEIDWCASVNADAVELVVVSTVFREIEQHKDQSRAWLQSRAKTVTGWLREKHKAPVVRDGVTLFINAKDPKNAEIEDLGLSPDTNDDRLIACIIQDRARTDAAQLLVTTDDFLAIKAEPHNIPSVRPPEENRIPPAPDPLERENRELKRQLDQRPKLSLAFEEQKSHQDVRLRVFDVLDDAVLKDVHTEVTNGYTNPLFMAVRALQERPPSQTKIDHYLKTYDDWLAKNYDTLVNAHLSFKLSLKLRNDGGGPALDTDIYVTVPSSVSLVEPSGLDYPPPPAKPKWESILDPFRVYRDELAGYEARRLASRAVAVALDLDRNETVNVREDGHTLHLRLRQLKHHMAHSIPLELWFENRETALEATGFSIEYQIHSSNVPDLQRGSLNVKLDARLVPFSTHFLSRRGTEDETL